jgi:uncharacterized membrane protein YraQ (UPF0718 family)/zinc transporter ZupT
MGALILSLLPLAVGPFLVAWAHRARAATIAIDSFVLVAIGGLVVLHLLPESLAQGGWMALLALPCGFFAPLWAERGLQKTQARKVVVIVSLVALLIHAIIDGIALTSGQHEHDPGLTGPHAHDHSLWQWAVILHRIPEGISVWWIVARSVGRRVAIVTLSVLACGTLLGYFAGEAALGGAPPAAIAVFGALLSGSLLHVVLHDHVPPPADARPRRWQWASTIGMLAAVVSVAVISPGHMHATPGETPAGHDHGEGSLFMALALESAPALLLAYLGVGMSQVFLPRSWFQGVSRGSRLGQALRGVAIGLPLPVCSCGVVPIYRQLVTQGASMSAAIAFLIATPELEIAATLLTWKLIGPEFTLVRLVAAAVLALVVGMLIGTIVKPWASLGGEHGHEAVEPPRPSLGARLGEALRFGYGKAVDHTAAWILVGLGLAALLMPHLDPAGIAHLPRWADVPMAALLGLPLYVCASGSTPLAAVLIFQGLSPGAALAFLLTGPATNMTTFGMLGALHGRRAAVLFTITMLICASLLGYATNWVLAAPSRPVWAEPRHGEHFGLLNVACLSLLTGVFFLSIVRLGTRRFIEQLFLAPLGDSEPPAPHGGCHAHDQGHDHVHAH